MAFIAAFPHFRIRRNVCVVFALLCIAAAYLGFADILLPNDKLIHFATFAVLTSAFYWMIDTKSRPFLRVSVITVCILIAGVGSEFFQSIVNRRRRFDPYDILSNVAGSTLALVVNDLAHKTIAKRRRSQRLARQTSDVEMADAHAGPRPATDDEKDDHDRDDYILVEPLSQ